MDADDKHVLQNVWMARDKYGGTLRSVKCGSEGDAEFIAWRTTLEEWVCEMEVKPKLGMQQKIN